MVKWPLEDRTVKLEACNHSEALCFWIILAPVGMPTYSKGHNEISLNIKTFWACALLEVDKCALQKLRSGMRADSFMALSKTEPAWWVVSFLSVPAGRCLCICVLTSISIRTCVRVWGTSPEMPFLHPSVLVSDLFSTDFWCILKSWAHSQINCGNRCKLFVCPHPDEDSEV